MASWTTVVLSALFLVTVCNSYSLEVGSAVNNQLAYSESVKLSGIPLTTRTKNVFYTGDRPIKGVMAIDRALGSKAKATITAGGVGSTFVNIRLKGERGERLDYQIQVFV